jgi:hypothetical protein
LVAADVGKAVLRTIIAESAIFLSLNIFVSLPGSPKLAGGFNVSVMQNFADGRSPGAPVPPILPPKEGYLFLDKVKFAASFAGDVDPRTAAFMADCQVPWGVDALEGAVTEPAWRSKPSWYLQVGDDKMICLSRSAVYGEVEVPGSHAIYV